MVHGSLVFGLYHASGAALLKLDRMLHKVAKKNRADSLFTSSPGFFLWFSSVPPYCWFPWEWCVIPVQSPLALCGSVRALLARVRASDGGKIFLGSLSFLSQALGPQVSFAEQQ